VPSILYVLVPDVPKSGRLDHERLMTSASPIGPSPNPAVNLDTALYATPTVPMPFRAAVMQPVTNVPWCASDSGPGDGSERSSSKSYELATSTGRSGCVVWILSSLT